MEGKVGQRREMTGPLPRHATEIVALPVIRLCGTPNRKRDEGQSEDDETGDVEAEVFREAVVQNSVPREHLTEQPSMQIVDSAYGGASGLEHQNSHVDIFAPPYIGSEFQPSLYAHEIFHAWNVKRLRPSEMWPYKYSHPQPTPWLWVSEGITDYYADLAEVRGGVVDEKGFYALTAEKINEVMNAAPIALEDASLNAWTHPVDGTEYIYYPKGSLAGLLLDIMSRGW